MATFTPLPPLTTRITLALAELRRARFDGSAAAITLAQRKLDNLVDCLPIPGPVEDN